MTVRIIVGDALEQLGLLPADSVHCCVTSPPYYGLRDYGCAGQIGLEPTPDEYIAVLVAVFREVRRVLRPDGTLWVVIGDSYAGASVGWRAGNPDKNGGNSNGSGIIAGCKPKDLLGIPWMLAFALRADGWYLRQEIIWHKLNPMPESVQDRCTRAHEYIFMLSKSERYWFDAAAIAEPSTWNHNRFGNKDAIARRVTRLTGNMAIGAPEETDRTGRNKRSVWTVASEPFSDWTETVRHFATFPPALIEPAILAGCPRECCAKCGAPWVRGVERETRPNAPSLQGKYNGDGVHRTISGGVSNDARVRLDRGFTPSCRCNAGTLRGTVIDPFGGAGTTGLVADRLGRDALLIELNPLYAGMSERRIYRDGPLFADVAIKTMEMADAAE